MNFPDPLFDDKLCKFIDSCMSPEMLNYDPNSLIEIPTEIPVGIPIAIPHISVDALAFPTSTYDTVNNADSSIPNNVDYINHTADAVDTFEFFKNFDLSNNEEDHYNDFLNYNIFCSVNIKNNIATNKFHAIEIHKKHKKSKSTLPLTACVYYECLYNGCNRKYCHTDGVKKHAKKMHSEWINGKKPEEYALQIILFPK